MPHRPFVVAINVVALACLPQLTQAQSASEYHVDPAYFGTWAIGLPGQEGNPTAAVVIVFRRDGTYELRTRSQRRSLDGATTRVESQRGRWGVTGDPVPFREICLQDRGSTEAQCERAIFANKNTFLSGGDAFNRVLTAADRAAKQEADAEAARQKIEAKRAEEAAEARRVSERDALPVSDRVYFDFDVDRPAVGRPNNPVPVYPAALLAAGIEGRVEASFIVDTTGHVDMSTVRIVESTSEAFSEAVRANLARMRFFPAELNGRPVRIKVQQPFTFAGGK